MGIPANGTVLRQGRADNNRAVLVEVQGELGGNEAPRLREAVKCAMKDGAVGLVFDLRGCPSIGALCLAALFTTGDVLRRHSRPGVAVVALPNSKVAHELELSSDGSRLPVFSSAPRALMVIDQIRKLST